MEKSLQLADFFNVWGSRIESIKNNYYTNLVRQGQLHTSDNKNQKYQVIEDYSISYGFDRLKELHMSGSVQCQV